MVSGAKEQIGVWVVSAAVAFLGLGLFGVRIVPARLDRPVFWLGIIALFVMVLCRALRKPRPVRQPEITPQLIGEIREQVIRPSSSREFAGERVVETEVLLKVSVNNLSPVPAQVVQWTLHVEVDGKACHVEGPLYLAHNVFGPPEVNWAPLESIHEQARWPDELASWCDVTQGKPAVGWLAFFIQGASASELQNARIALRMKDSFGRAYEAQQQSTRLAA